MRHAFRIAVIDHSFHAQTKSTEFIFDILAECGEVDRLYCDRWQGGPGVDIAAIRRQGYDAVVFIQQMYHPRELARVADPRKIVLVPMYDAVAGWTAEAWRRYRSFPIVSFSSTLDQIATAGGCRSAYIRYFPDCKRAERRLDSETKSGWHVFFWERQPSISWATVKTLLGDLPIAKLWYKPCPDPGASASTITAEDRARYSIQEVGWLPSRDDYLRLVAQSHIYVAPRPHEGIGMSFLEAMAMGTVVVAPNHATMNEYIVHGRNGVLYDVANPRPAFRECDIRKMMERVEADTVRYRSDWQVGRAAFQAIVLEACARRVPKGLAITKWLGSLVGR